MFFILLFVVPSVSVGQWRQTEGPVTGIGISHIVSTGSALLASAPCGIFRSEDEGNSWSPASNETFTTSEIFKDTLYLGGENLRKVLQTDANWLERYSLYKKGKVFDLYSDEKRIYAAMELSGFSYSSDGKNWIKLNEGLPQDARTLYPNGTYYTHDVFAVDGNDQYIFAGTKKGIFRSAKANLRWSVIAGIAENNKVNALLCKDSFVFMATENKIYKSANNGTTWELSHTFSSGNLVNKLITINDILFALTLRDGVYSSVNLGNSWTANNSGLSNLAANSITKYKNNYFLANESGVYRNLSHWEKVCNHIICSDIIDLEKNESGIAAVNFYNVYISKDQGKIWTNSTDSIQMRVLNSVVNVNNSFFFSASGPGYVPQNSINYSLSANGQTWTKKTNLPFYDDPYLLRSNGSKLIAVTDDLVFLSGDNGSTWRNISPPGGLVCNNFNDALFTGNTIYIAACGQGEVLKSIDYGVNWSFVNQDLPSSEVYTLGECQGVLFAATRSYLYRLGENENYWEYCGKGIPKYNHDLSTRIEDFASNDQYFFLCTPDSIYASANRGHSWANINQGLPRLPNNLWGGSLLVNDSLLYFGTNNYGVWKLNISNLQLPAQSTEKVENVLCYPNPVKGILYFKTPENETIKRVDFITYSGILFQSFPVKDNKLNVRPIPEGIYILRMLTGKNEFAYSRIIKLN